MGAVEMVWSDEAVEVHRVVVGPVDNNVYVVRDRRRGIAALIDAANEHNRLLEVCASLGVDVVLETHGHWDHIQAVGAVREAGLEVWVGGPDADQLSGYDRVIEDDSVITVGDVRLRAMHTPGHTPGSVSFLVEGAPLVFTGDTLFPGGPGATHFPGGDFPTIITSIEERFFRPLAPDVVIWPGHGAPSTIGEERPHLDEWVERGW
ncbi:MAG TPA: MBL fold metallo-hydrolase [Acidimicrobiales bacterium]|nr:MBL fold metallo-hydrolase [Acidimicrobiales bacterium]